MDMNFPHRAASVHARRTRTEYGAYITSAALRQNSGATATAMSRTANECKSYGSVQNDTLEARMHYFAGAAYPTGAYQTGAGTAPYGAFVPLPNREFRDTVIYDQAVYQDGLVISKLQGIFDVKSELQITKSGQEN